MKRAAANGSLLCEVFMCEAYYEVRCRQNGDRNIPEYLT
jgi:hypothetical protein